MSAQLQSRRAMNQPKMHAFTCSLKVLPQLLFLHGRVAATQPRSGLLGARRRRRPSKSPTPFLIFDEKDDPTSDEGIYASEWAQEAMYDYCIKKKENKKKRKKKNAGEKYSSATSQSTLHPIFDKLQTC